MWWNRASGVAAGAELICLTWLTSACVAAGAADYKVLHFFAGGAGKDGGQSSAGLLNVGGVLYGTTTIGNGLSVCNPSDPVSAQGCGTVFSITRSGTETVRYSFLDAPDGAFPATSLLFSAGKLYGTTVYGGDPGERGGGIFEMGTVFSLSPAGVETVVYRFNGPTDGSHPTSAPIAIGGTLYGATSAGGTAGLGAIYALTPDGSERVLHSFQGGADGWGPAGNLINVNGVLYGVTSLGGNGHCADGCGTVFSITPAGVETVLLQFQGGLKGAGPTGGLLLVGNELYGTTSHGGASSAGTVFSLALDGTPTGSYSLSLGSSPNGPLINVGGKLYGTTYQGGTNCPDDDGCGTVFSMTLSGQFSVLYNFQGGPTDGRSPEAGLVDIGGVLYGTTFYAGNGGDACGAYGCGAVFAIRP